MVEDEALLDELHSLRKYLQELEINDQKIVSEYASYYNLISNDGEISRKKLKKKIHTDRVQGNRIPENVLTIAKQSEIIYFKIRTYASVIRITGDFNC
jgi:hypothetical protein